jgi:hypothetical protein
MWCLSVLCMFAERMMSTIVALQRNPLARAQLSGIERDDPNKQQSSSKDAHAPVRMNETLMLERTLEKLTGLLQVGFGAAGSRMIAKALNLNAGLGAGGAQLDPLVAGRTMLGIYGFCDIRRFTDATECLREEVMPYVRVQKHYSSFFYSSECPLSSARCKFALPLHPHTHSMFIIIVVLLCVGEFDSRHSSFQCARIRWCTQQEYW